MIICNWWGYEAALGFVPMLKNTEVCQLLVMTSTNVRLSVPYEIFITIFQL